MSFFDIISFILSNTRKFVNPRTIIDRYNVIANFKNEKIRGSKVNIFYLKTALADACQNLYSIASQLQSITTGTDTGIRNIQEWVPILVPVLEVQQKTSKRWVSVPEHARKIFFRKSFFTYVC
jgi:hypothetical protein